VEAKTTMSLTQRLRYAGLILEYAWRTIPVVLQGKAIVIWQQKGKIILFRSLLKEEQEMAKNASDCEEWRAWVAQWEHWVIDPTMTQHEEGAKEE
jgi:hypothetical protein